MSLLPLAPLSGRASDAWTCESRAILDEGLHWTTPDGARRLLARITTAGFNVLVPCVWYGRGTTWPSNRSPWDDRLGALIDRNYDPVAHLFDQASKFNVEIHPWFTVGRRARDFFGRFADGSDSKSFNFYNSDFRSFIVDIVLEFLHRYPAQGVNLDYVRFMRPRPGYESEREELVADVVRRISREGKRLRPDLVVSVDAAPWEPTMKQFGQDALKWSDEGIVDIIYSMQYQPQPDFDAAVKLKAAMKRPESLVVMVGNFDRTGLRQTVVPRAPDHLARLLTKSRALSEKNGVALYYYGMLSDTQVEELRKTVFRFHSRTCWRLASQT